MRVFVAGATGVLGRRAVPLLVAQRPRRQRAGPVRPRPPWSAISGPGRCGPSCSTPSPWRGAVAGHEVVCNLATHIPPSLRMALPGAWAENDRIRTEASRNLVDAALAARPAATSRSRSPFSTATGDRWIDESSPIDPVANLGSATVAESHAARVTASGAAGVVLRFAAFYGPDSASTLDMIGLARRRIALGAGPDRYLSSITTDDAAAAVVASLSAPAGLYNVGDDEPVTRREFFAALAGALGVRPRSSRRPGSPSSAGPRRRRSSDRNVSPTARSSTPRVGSPLRRACARDGRRSWPRACAPCHVGKQLTHS